MGKGMLALAVVLILGGCSWAEESAAECDFDRFASLAEAERCFATLDGIIAKTTVYEAHGKALLVVVSDFVFLCSSKPWVQVYYGTRDGGWQLYAERGPRFGFVTVRTDDTRLTIGEGDPGGIMILWDELPERRPESVGSATGR